MRKQSPETENRYLRRERNDLRREAFEAGRKLALAMAELQARRGEANMTMDREDRLCLMAAILAAGAFERRRCSLKDTREKTDHRRMAEWAVGAAREIVKVIEGEHV